MRLTLDVLRLSTSFLNPLQDRELDLRGNKIVALENLSATRDQHDAIDLSDNELKRLDNFPPLPRLKHLYVSNNRIAKLDPLLPTKLASLQTLVLTMNNISELSDLALFAGFPSLSTLSLLDNPVTKKANYRLFVINLIPSLKMLDFGRVSAHERRQARLLVAQDKELSDLTRSAPSAPSSTAVSSAPSNGPAGSSLSPGQQERIKAAIAAAGSLEEISMLEKALSTGYIPDALQP